MLAAPLVGPRDSEEQLLQNLKNVTYPVLATPKLDGIRCVTLPGALVPLPTPLGQQSELRPMDHISKPVCRSLKEVPNDHIRDTLATLPPGFDGEIMTYSERDLFDGIIRPRAFNDIQSDVMAHAGHPNFKFHVFDMLDPNIHEDGPRINYEDRVRNLESAKMPDFVVKVLPTVCRNIEELQDFMSQCIRDGHEGVCFRRSMHCPYKFGRSTLREGWLVKWKLFETSEATIIGFEEEMHNNNPAAKNLVGNLARPSHQENMIPKNRLGSFICQVGDVQFKIGTGFTADMRIEFWNQRESLLGKLVTFRSQGHGAKTAPRIPVFVGIRSKIDMST